MKQGSKRRSESKRSVFRKAIWEREARETAEAYARIPDRESVYVDPSVWEALARARVNCRKK